MAGELDIVPDSSGSDQIDQLHRSQEFASTRSPEDAAGTFNYAKAAGLSFEGAEQQKKALPLPAPSWGALVKDHPVLSRYLSEPGFAAAAQDDVHNLSALERLFGGWDEMLWKSKQALADDARNQELAWIGRVQRSRQQKPILENSDGTFSTESTITVEADGRYYVMPTIVNGKRYTPEDASAMWKNGKNPSVGDFASEKEANDYAQKRHENEESTREGDRVLEQRALELEKEAQEPSPDIGFVPGIVPAVVGVLPGMARALPTAAAYGAGGVLGGTFLTKNPRAGLAAGGAMAGAGFVAGMAMDTARTEQGLSYREYLKMGADPQTAGIASDLVALANGGLQAIPAEKVLNVVPGLRSILQGRATRDIMRRLIGSNTGRAVLARFAGRVAESGLLMALIGSGQELVKEVGGIAATSGDMLPSELGGSVQDWNPEDGDRSGGTGEGLSGSKILNAGLGGLQQGLGFGFAHAALPALAEKREAELGEARTTMFKAIAGIATDSKLRERMPAEFKAYANDVINEHGKVAEVKVPAEALSNLFQKEGIDPVTVQENMPEIAKQLRDSKPGDEVVIPTADLVTNIAHLKSFPELLQDLRYGDDLTPRESKEVQKEAEKIAKEKPKAEEEPPATPERKVYDDVFKKLVDAGQDPGVAQHDAALWSAFAKSRGERTGTDPFEYYSKRALSIGAEMGEISLGQKYKPGETYKFPISSLKLDDQNFKEAQENIQRGQGSQTEGPIKLYRREGSRKLEVGDGHHRIIEAIHRGESEIEGRIEKEALPREMPAEVDGLKVRKEIPNTESIAASLTHYRTLGVKALKFSDFEAGPDKNPDARTRKLSEEIAASKEINPLIVVKDDKGYYILEGAHRYDALGLLGKKEFPALVVEDTSKTALEQKTAEGYRGKISFDNARSYFRITLTGKANLSTFLHESGHAFFEFMRKDAESGHAESVAEFEKLRAWLGTKAGEAPSTEQLEAFARGFEGYLLEGKAPAAGLRETFRAFSAWLKLVYRSIANLGVNLTDDVRGVMDRMLATDKEIKEAQKNIGFEPMKKPEGMTPAEYKAYTERFSKAMEASKNALEAQALKEYGQMIGAHREAVRADVEEASKLDPVHNAYEALRNGKRLDGSEIPEEIKGKKLDRAAVEAAGHKGIKWMQITAKEGGLDPEVAAPYYGFKNSTEMLDKLEARRPRAKEIKEETDRRMAEMYPNADIAKMADQAMKAVHTNEVGNVLWSEAQAVDKQMGGKGEIRTARAVVKEVAKRRVSEMTMIEMQPGRFSRAEERAAKEWAEAYKKEDFRAAHTAKLDQIMAHEMWKATTDAKEEVFSIRDYLSKFNDLSVRRRMGKAGQNYINAIDKILEDVDLKKVTNKELGRRASLDSYLREMEEEGGTVTIPNELRSEAGLKNFKQMTLEDLRAVHDAVANIESMARLKNFLFDGRERRNFQETATKAGAHIAANLGTPFAEKPGTPQNPGWWEKRKAWLRESRAEKKKIEFIARELDGGQTAGLLHELIFQPFATAAGKAHEWGEKVTEALLKPLKDMTFKERLELDRTVDFLGTPMKLRDALAVALNMGNDGNKRKLLEGYAYRHWTEENVTKRLGELLTDKHLDLIQHVWNTINTLWPEIKALSERTTGVAPPKVEAAKLTIRGRELEGGYYPIVYDRERSYKAEQLAQKKGDLFENNFLKPGVSKGFTESRTRFAAPLLLSMNIIPAHINEVIHYLTHYEPVRAVDRLLAHPTMRQAITEGLGREVYNLFRPWLQAIAHDGVVPGNLTGIDNALRHLRVGAAVTRLGFRLTNSIMQGFNLLSSIKELGGAIEGPKYLGLGIKRWMEDVESFRDPFANVYEKSAEMKGKSKNIEHELINNFDHYTSAFSEFGAMKERLGHFAMSFMTLAWRTCDTITWYAAREKAFDEGHNRPEEYADSVVRLSQMGEGIKDKAAIMRGGEGTKIFTNMYAWYSTIYNQLTETQPQNRSNWKKVGELASRYWWMTLAPAVLMGIARGKGPKHDKDETSSWLKYYGEEVALEIAKPWPIAGVIAETMLSEHEARFGPWISTVLRGMKARGKMIQGEPLSEHEKQDIVQSTGITSHLPATAMWNAYKYVSAVQDGKLEEPIRDMLLRAPGEWK